MILAQSEQCCLTSNDNTTTHVLMVRQIVALMIASKSKDKKENIIRARNANKKAVLSQGKRAMLQLFFSV